ncbi:hypothetical protein SEEH4316_05282, partial [Salmonella enterica subsp. enterica serovar Heidelberg str. RI-11-014316]
MKMARKKDVATAAITTAATGKLHSGRRRALFASATGMGVADFGSLTITGGATGSSGIFGGSMTDVNK